MDKLKTVLSQINLLSEAPIVNIDVMGGVDEDGFDSSSVKFIHNPKFKHQLERSWEKSHGEFDIRFIGGVASKWVEYGLASLEEVENKLGVDNFTQDTNAITIFFTNNKGAELKPMTPWIAAHRVGHVIRAGVTKDAGIKQRINQLEDIFVNLINKYLTAYGLFQFRIEKINQFIRFIGIDKEVAHGMVNRIGTMRSARQESIDRPFEFFYELFAQHLTTGRVKFNRTPKPFMYEGKEYTFKGGIEKEIELLEVQFTNFIKHLLDYCEGKIFIM